MFTAAQVSWLVCMLHDLEFRTDQLVRKHSRGSLHRPQRTSVPAICYKPATSASTSASAGLNEKPGCSSSTSVSVSGGLNENDRAASCSGSVAVDDVDVTVGGADVLCDGVTDGGQTVRSGAGAGVVTVSDGMCKGKHQCDVCNKLYSSAGNLTKHKRTHTGEQPYQCTDCGRAFSDPSNLTQHKRTHTGEQPYKCTDCGRAFSNPSNLTRHRRNVHHYMH